MKDSTRMKWRMLKQVLRSDNCILISFEDDSFDYRFAGDTLLFAQLFHRLKTFIPKWYQQWAGRSTYENH